MELLCKIAKTAEVEKLEFFHLVNQSLVASKFTFKLNFSLSRPTLH